MLVINKKFSIFRRLWLYLLVVGVFMASFVFDLEASSEGHADAMINPQIPPSRSEWIEFMGLESRVKEDLWESFTGRGVFLRDWSWDWRSGWIISCRVNFYPSCRKILLLGLQDKSIVVRIRAVKTIGYLYAGTKSREVINALARVYNAVNKKNDENYLKIKHKILFAMHNIGGDLARAKGEILASKNAMTRKYWKKLQG